MTTLSYFIKSYLLRTLLFLQSFNSFVSHPPQRLIFFMASIIHPLSLFFSFLFVDGRWSGEAVQQPITRHQHDRNCGSNEPGETHTRTYIHTYVRTYIYIRAYIHTRTHTRTYTHTYIHTYTHISMHWYPETDTYNHADTHVCLHDTHAHTVSLSDKYTHTLTHWLIYWWIYWHTTVKKRNKDTNMRTHGLTYTHTCTLTDFYFSLFSTPPHFSVCSIIGISHHRSYFPFHLIVILITTSSS